MKKQTKIIALAFVLALVCCIFAISAFAGVGYDYSKHTAATGEILYSYMDFELTTFTGDTASNNTGSSTAPKNSGDSVKTNNNKQFALIFAHRSGEAKIETSEHEDNKYLVIWNDKSTLYAAGKGPYINIPVGSNPSNGAAVDTDTTGAMIKYNQAYVADYDVMFGEGTIPSGTGLGYQVRRYNAAGTKTFLGNNKDGNIANFNVFQVNFRTGEGGKIELYLTENGQEVKSTTYIPYEQWMHVTFVLETPTNDNGTPDNAADDYSEFHVRVFINDVLALSADDYDYSDIKTEDFYKSDRLNIVIPEARWSFGADNTVGASKVAIDNFAVRRYNNSYDMTGLKASLASGDLSTWAGSIYDDALLPYGVTFATIQRGDGDPLEFDKITEAIAAAQAGETIKLQKNITDPVVVNNVVVIEKNGFEIEEISAAPGYAVFDGDTDDVEGNEGTYYVQESSGTLRVMWGACACGNHAATTVNVPLNNNIYDSYEQATGIAPECSYTEDNIFYEVVGWTASGNSGITGTLSEDAVVTAAMLGKTLRLTPVYEENAPTARVLKSDGTVKKYYYKDSTLATVINGAAAGETVQLLADYDNPSKSAMSISKNITFDLNGHRVSTLVDGATKKYDTFSIKANVTFISSVPGGQLYNAKYNSSNGAFNGSAVFTCGAAGSKITVNGADADGNTTISVYCATLTYAYNSYMDVEINGGEYYRTASDNVGMFDHRAASAISIKNCYINCSANLYRNAVGVATGDGTAATVTIDNCIIDGNIANNNQHANRPATRVNITNSYLNGQILPVSGLITIGAGCYLTDACTTNEFVTYAEGYKGVATSFEKTYTTNANKFKVDDAGKYDASTFATPAVETTTRYTTAVVTADAQPVRVTWYDVDGTTVIGVTEDAYAGLNATAPITVVEGTDGWVKASYTDWSDGAKIPAGVTEYAFTLQSTDGVIYSAGNVGVMFNFDMIAHYQYNFYIPEAPEGVSIVSAVFGGTLSGTTTDVAKYSATDTDGNKYHRIPKWPTAHGAASDATITVNYTYGGQEISYAAPAFSIADYANYIFDTEKYDATPLETAMADMLRYVKAACALAGRTTNDAFNTIYTKAETLMTPDTDLKTENIDLSAVSAYVEKVELLYSTGLGGASLAVTAKGDYGINFVAKYDHGSAICNQTRRLTDGAFRAHNVRTWGLAETFTIEVYEGYTMAADGQTVNVTGELVATFDYSVAAYLGAKGETLDANSLELVKAILAYGASAEAYLDWKVENGIGR